MSDEPLTSAGPVADDDLVVRARTDRSVFGQLYDRWYSHVALLNVPEAADAHYAGNGVKRDTKDRPIFWYRSEETKKFRVLYADLSVRNAESAPQIEGARGIEKASKTSRPTEK